MVKFKDIRNILDKYTIECKECQCPDGEGYGYCDLDCSSYYAKHIKKEIFELFDMLDITDDSKVQLQIPQTIGKTLEQTFFDLYQVEPKEITPNLLLNLICVLSQYTQVKFAFERHVEDIKTIVLHLLLACYDEYHLAPSVQDLFNNYDRYK